MGFFKRKTEEGVEEVVEDIEDNLWDDFIAKEFKVTKKQMENASKEVNHAAIDSKTIIDLVKILFKNEPKEKQLKIYLYHVKMQELMNGEED